MHARCCALNAVFAALIVFSPPPIRAQTGADEVKDLSGLLSEPVFNNETQISVVPPRASESAPQSNLGLAADVSAWNAQEGERQRIITIEAEQQRRREAAERKAQEDSRLNVMQILTKTILDTANAARGLHF